MPSTRVFAHVHRRRGDTANAADLSSSNRFKELIAVVSPLFDWIIVDSSPVNVVADGV